MQFDRYRWQDRVLDPYRWSIDVAVTTVFAVALSASAIMHLTGDAHRPEPTIAFVALTKAKSVQHTVRQNPPALDCGLAKLLPGSAESAGA